MLDKSKLIYLNKEKKYDEIYSVFLEEYTSMIIDILRKNGVDYICNAPMSYYIQLLKTVENGRYNDVADKIIRIFSDSSLNNIEVINLAVDTYNIIKKEIS